MSDTPTEHYHYVKPEIGASADDWGRLWNENLDALDADLHAVSGVAAGACAKSSNLSDLANAATARTNLGVQIGANVQGYTAVLASLSTLGPSGALNNLLYFNGANSIAQTPISGFSAALITAATQGDWRTGLGLGGTALKSFNVTVSTSGPSGGSDGDVWVVVP